MLTPRFKLKQDENHVFITINAPYTNISETEIDIDGENFLFVSSPYFLRLQLPGKIVENENAKGAYVCDTGDFNLMYEKETRGEHFENLDMITSLLAPRDIPNVNPDLVQMLEEDGVADENDNDEDDDTASVDSIKYTYGFGNKISTQFCEIGTEFPQIFELKTPERVPLNERNVLRQRHENHKFSSDHYLADFFDDELLAPYQNAIAIWERPDFKKEEEFTDDEISILKEMPNKHYILTKSEHRQIYLGLVDILFAYCYDKRTTLNEGTVESSWTINKLSATLSWFCIFNEYKEVLVACYRRALTYPIFRNFELCNKVKNDLVTLFKNGKRFVIKCMIEVYKMFNLSNDARYILNQLYIKDYLVYIQKCRTEEIEDICTNIANTEITKGDLNLELEEFEAAAEMVQAEDHCEIMENEMALKMASMSLIPGLKQMNLQESHFQVRDDESDSSDSSSDSSSSSSDSSSELDSDDDDPF